MTLIKKLLLTIGMSFTILLVGCGEKVPEDFREYQPLEITQSASDLPDKNEPTIQESADSFDSSAEQQYHESTQSDEQLAVSSPEVEPETAECAVAVDYIDVL